MAKKKRRAEIVFALVRFPQCAEDIELAYRDKDVFDKTVKDIESLFNTLSGDETVHLRKSISETLSICDKLKNIDENLHEIVCTSPRFCNKRAKCLKKAQRVLSSELFQEGEQLLSKCEENAFLFNKYGVTHTKICSMLRKISKARAVVKDRLSVLSKCSDNPKRHFKYLYKGLDK